MVTIIDLGKYKGLPIYWKSKNEKCIIVYEQCAFTGKYKLYLNGKYVDSSDFMSELVTIAKRSYFYRR
jgi:hypothetical protein